jgi:Arc/MetJ family transcription regulator
MSLIAEGTANYGVEVAFPGNERTEFEQRVLYPLAGIDPARAAEFNRVMQLLEELKHVNTQAARKRVDGELDAEATAAYLRRYGLLEADRAKKYVQFIDAMRSYVINYGHGLELVRAWIHQAGRTQRAQRTTLGRA